MGAYLCIHTYTYIEIFVYIHTQYILICVYTVYKYIYIYAHKYVYMLCTYYISILKGSVGLEFGAAWSTVVLISGFVFCFCSEVRGFPKGPSEGAWVFSRN